jgi:eukaryotic-like serine/threonine-protein kinase
VILGGSVVRGLQPGDPQTIGPYRLVGQLGSGGMGRVFLGVSAGGRPVAVKVIRAELVADPEFRMRFGREVASARRVSGVFTAPVVDADVDGTPAWLATAYVPGPSLSEAVASHGPLPGGALLTLTAGLAESLSAIHAAGVVHRDLKPSNVLIAEDGPRVIDFGISRAAESTALTQAGLVIGSPGFMSPEQAAGYEVGAPTDIFSLGAVLAFAATGEGPFGAGTTAALLYRVVHGAPGLDQVPAEVRPLIERCLAKEPGQRPTANGLLAEVGALQPTASWLPESIIRAFAQDAAPGPAPSTAGIPFGSEAALEAATRTTAANSAEQVPSGEGLPVALAGISQAATSGSRPAPTGGMPPPGDAYSQPPGGGANQPRRRWLRPLALAWVLGFLVAAGVAIFAVTAFTGHTPTPGQSPAAQISSPTGSTSAGRTPSGAATSGGASASSRASSGASSFPGTSQSAGVSASPSVFSSQPPTGSASASSSPSASRKPTPTPTATRPPTPTPTASAHPTPTPSAPAPTTSAAASTPTSAPAS